VTAFADAVVRLMRCYPVSTRINDVANDDVEFRTRGTRTDSESSLLVAGQKSPVTSVIYRFSPSLCDADPVLAHGAMRVVADSSLKES
jgi:hypothetical protein